VYIATFIFKTKKSGVVATIITLLTFVIQTIGIGLRWYESYQMGYGHAPLTNMYESLVFFSWSIVIFYLLLEVKFKNRLIGAFAIPFAFTSMAYASFGKGITQAINPLIPALQSYAAFAVACGLGFMYLMKASSKNNSADSLLATLPDLKVIDDITHKTIIFGFIWLTAGIITGAVWANSAWGTYWSWDPKETWSLITWFIYAATLHARFTRGWQGKRIAWLAILGFFCVIFTYFGVNFLLSGLHSYGSS
jgi:cytochrome c-type biogenesis protein CcsB